MMLFLIMSSIYASNYKELSLIFSYNVIYFTLSIFEEKMWYWGVGHVWHDELLPNQPYMQLFFSSFVKH